VAAFTTLMHLLTDTFLSTIVQARYATSKRIPGGFVRSVQAA
jgi:hypothetical protein